MDTWTKSSYSNNSGGECVEVRVAAARAWIDVRDSRTPDLGHLSFGTAEWRAFLAEADRL
ncbi:DUF397 domain-containing protein [Streptomonospora litoralis]|uniref:DUF397 domain-containing protein n=1 Tax=Streptomonospora litoralis TaxID=2498135 RepID=A0A4P6Q061_9ACTN|nr:DUF397 domain-containing protein [Streptomonospora litoralis]QBI53793.1 hypothetical protein EKD16_10025 [Streptomonospora litoralis]